MSVQGWEAIATSLYITENFGVRRQRLMDVKEEASPTKQLRVN